MRLTSEMDRSHFAGHRTLETVTDIQAFVELSF